LLAIALLAAPPAADANAPRFVDPAVSTRAVLQALDERLALMDGVAAAKWQAGTPILDATRERQVLEQVSRLAQGHGLAGPTVVAVFELQMRLARDWQTRRHAAWQELGGLPPGTVVPDLATQVRPRLDALTTRQLELFAQERGDWIDPALLQAAYRRESATFPALSSLAAEDREALWAALAGLRHAQGSALQRVRRTGILRVGLTGDYAPFSLEEASGTLTGTDVILAERLADHLAGDGLEGGTVHYVRTTWRTLLPDLLAGRFEVAVGGISVTADRAARAAFSPPYHHGGKTLLARCADGTRYATLADADRPEVRVLVNPGGTNERFVQARFRQAQVRVIPDNRAVFAALLAGDGDLMVTDDVEVALQTRLHPGLCRATDLLFEPAAKAVMLLPEPELQTAVDRWMQTELAAGVPARLLAQALRADSRPTPRATREIIRP
jgi:cyclohexadienyl dehydratase